MRRLLTLVAVVLVVAAGSAGTVAQGSRPGADEAPLPDGVTFDHLAQTQVEALLAPAFVALVRIALDPGVRLTLEADDPPALVEVESGAWTVSAPAWVRMGEVDGTPVVAEVSADRVEFTLPPGDGTDFPLPFGGDVRNDGPVPAVAVLLLIQPGITEATPGATPAPFGAEGAEGVTIQPLAFGRVTSWPEGPVALVVGRLTLAPGAFIPPHPQCGGHVGSVESGRLSVRTVKGSAPEVARGQGMATPVAEPEATGEAVGPGTDTILGAGDGVFVPPGSVCEARAVGDEPAVMLVAFLDPAHGQRGS
jgi:quercetin dioxygenase-like cupin family protein